ncbi:signal peptidase I [Oscillospiraceae bacterium NTUH-002-81]|nr:signal peptidase I [Oscillospiraceae bacterium NTUH-002-81]
MGRRMLKKYDGKKQGWLRQGKELAVFIILMFVVFRFIIGVSLVNGSSMNPSLKNGDVVVYTRIVPNYESGDIVCIRMPSGEYYIKRVIGLAGDTVEIRDGSVYVNSTVREENYAQGRTETQGDSIKYPYEVKADRVFVLGDNREESMDSRTFGAVAKSQIRGKVLFSFSLPGHK